VTALGQIYMWSLNNEIQLRMGTRGVLLVQCYLISWAASYATLLIYITWFLFRVDLDQLCEEFGRRIAHT